MVNGIRSDQIGRLGERKFEDLCERSGLCVSTPTPDMTGKDRLVEFPFVEPTGYLTYDTRPAPLSCYVQVKTLLASNRSFKLLLSAAERLARDSKPTFVCVLRMNGKHEFKDMYLVHIDGAVLASVLKRLRLEHAKGEKHLNRKRISFSISAGRKVELIPDALRAALMADIGHDMSDYARDKDRQLKELGYDADRIRLNIEFGPMSPEQFVDGFLGLTELPVNRLESFERRFDILLAGPPGTPDPDNISNQTIRIEPRPADHCVMKFQSGKGVETATIEGDLYHPGIPGLPPDVAKILVKTDLMDIFVHAGHLKFKTNDGYGQGKRHSLQVWLETCRAWNLLLEGDCMVTLHMQKQDRDICLPPLGRPDSSEDRRWINGIIEIADAALELYRLAGARGNPVDIDDLIREGRRIVKARALMTGRREFRLSFTTDASIAGMELEEVDFLL